MMKQLLFLLLASFAVSIASAQVQFGLKGGLNLANMSVSPSIQNESFSIKTDFHAGALVNIPLFDFFSLQPEAMYSGEGAKVKLTYNSITATGNSNLGYINVPVFFKYNDPSGFFAEIGPQVGFLLSAKSKSSDGTTDIKNEFKSTDFSGVFGLGYLTSFNLGVDARYSLGLMNVSNSSGVTVKNNIIQVGVFYLIGGGRQGK